MLTLRIKLLNGLDRALAVALAGLLLGTALAFGGAVWWARPAIAGLTLAVALAWIARVALSGSLANPQEPALGARRAGPGPRRRPALADAREPGHADLAEVGGGRLVRGDPRESPDRRPGRRDPAPVPVAVPPDPRSPGYPPMARRGDGLPGPLLGGLALCRSVRQGPGDLGERGRGLLRQRGPRCRPGRPPLRRALRDRHAGLGPGLGTDARRCDDRAGGCLPPADRRSPGGPPFAGRRPGSLAHS